MMPKHQRPMGGGNMMKQVQKMQQDMLKAQAEIEAREFSATAGGGVVTAVVTGNRTVRALSIAPEAVDPDDIEMLQDMVVAAVNEALNTAESAMSAAMQRFTGGLNLPF